MNMLKTITLSTQIFLMTISSTYAQEDFQTTVAAREAREVVAEIRGGYGTFYLKRSSGEDLFTLREKRDPENARQDVAVDYTVDNGIGHLTVELGKTDGDNMNALACLFRGTKERTWYMTFSDRIPVRFDIAIGAGEALLNLDGLHIREFHLDAGAGSVRINVDSPNPEEIGDVSISAGVGSVKARKLGNLRFRSLEFEGGIGEYHLDCTGMMRDKSRIRTDIGVGSLVIVLPEGIAAKAVTSDHWFNSTKMSRFVRQSDDIYVTENYSQKAKHVFLDLESGVGSVTVRWAK